MAIVEIEDSIYFELCSLYPSKQELRTICTMQLAKLLHPARNKKPRKHTTITVHLEQEAMLTHQCVELRIRRNNLLMSLIREADLEELSKRLGQLKANHNRHIRDPLDGGDRSISFSPTSDVYKEWRRIAIKVNASQSFVMHHLIEMLADGHYSPEVLGGEKAESL